MQWGSDENHNPMVNISRTITCELIGLYCNRQLSCKCFLMKLINSPTKLSFVGELLEPATAHFIWARMNGLMKVQMKYTSLLLRRPNILYWIYRKHKFVWFCRILFQSRLKRILFFLERHIISEPNTAQKAWKWGSKQVQRPWGFRIKHAANSFGKPILFSFFLEKELHFSDNDSD